jgi:hypothetical protein
MKLDETLPRDLEVGDLVPGLGSVTSVRRGVEVEFSDGFDGPHFYGDDERQGFIGVSKPPAPAPKAGDWVRFTLNGAPSIFERRLAYAVEAEGVYVTDAARFTGQAAEAASEHVQLFGANGYPFDSVEVVERV